MENKEIAPKELWIPNYSFSKHWANPEKFTREDDNCTLIFDGQHKSMLSVRCTKYLSETHISELLESKDKEIDSLNKEIDRLHFIIENGLGSKDLENDI